MKLSQIKILYFSPDDIYFYLHWLPLACASKGAGYEVVLLTNTSTYKKKIISKGIKVVPINISNKSLNISDNLSLLKKIYFIYQEERPDLVHHIAVKPIYFGGMVSKLLKIPAILNCFSGLGYLFISNKIKIQIIRVIANVYYRILFNSDNCMTVFQNPDDLNYFNERSIIKSQNIRLIKGVGVNIDKFKYMPEEKTQEPIVLLAARMLWDKGVGEFIQAIKILRQEGVKARFVLVGAPDPGNPASIPPSQLEQWQECGLVEWWGYQSDMPGILAQSHIVCLPSYREGLPTVLIEGASCGKPLVAFDAPGCREVVQDNRNGFLAPGRDPIGLAVALKKLIQNPGLRRDMGRQGREIVEQEFSLSHVIDQMMALYSEMLEATRKR